MSQLVKMYKIYKKLYIHNDAFKGGRGDKQKETKNPWTPLPVSRTPSIPHLFAFFSIIDISKFQRALVIESFLYRFSESKYKQEP